MPIPWGPLISGGMSLLGLFGGGKSDEEKRIEAEQAAQSGLQTEGMRESLAFGRQFRPMALSTYRRGEKGATRATDYWSRILSGRTGATEVLSPEINQIINSYKQARRASRTLNPRGGGTTALTREIDEAIIPGQISGLLARARPAAAGALGTLGTQLMQLGGTGVGAAASMFNLGTGAGDATLGFGPQSREQQFRFGEKLSEGFGPLIDILFPGPKGNGNGTENGGGNGGGNGDGNGGTTVNLPPIFPPPNIPPFTPPFNPNPGFGFGGFG